jgi:hypothetical protein
VSEEPSIHRARDMQPSLIKLLGFETTISKLEWALVWYREWKRPTMYTSPRALTCVLVLFVVALVMVAWSAYQFGAGACVP